MLELGPLSLQQHTVFANVLANGSTSSIWKPSYYCSVIELAAYRDGHSDTMPRGAGC